MRDTIDSTEFFYIIDEQHYCCDESQFKYYCKNCYEWQGCYYCSFDYNQPCELCDLCQPLMIELTVTETEEI